MKTSHKSKLVKSCNSRLAFPHDQMYNVGGGGSFSEPTHIQPLTRTVAFKYTSKAQYKQTMKANQKKIY